MVVRRHTTQRARPSGPGVECQLRFGTNYLTGQPDLGDDLIALEAVWWHLRDKLLADHGRLAGRRPWGWWRFDVGLDIRPGTPPSRSVPELIGQTERQYLSANGLLADDERRQLAERDHRP